MKIQKLFVAALLLLNAAQAAAQFQMPPIPVDKNVRVGKLDNGLVYYIRHNEFPANTANFYIAQRVGSINENDDQRGLAHFLEHMAFNGSEHFPGNGIIDFTRTLGVEFGSNLNAYTSIDQTVYRICDVPTYRQSALDSCLLVLKDWSGGLTLDAKEIDKERGVVHQEWQMGADAGQRFYEKHLPDLFPGSKYGNRLPIGLMSIVDNFKPQVLRDYYKKWYRPDNQAIIVVGNVDVDHVEAEIKKLWNGVKVPANAAKVVAEPVPDNKEAIYVYYPDKEQKYSLISLMMKTDPTPDSAKVGLDYLANLYVIDVIDMMLTNRLNEYANQPDCPYAYAATNYGEYLGISKTKDCFMGVVVPKEGKDLEALATLERELLRARRHGFTATEYARAKEEYLSRIEKRFTNKDKTKNEVYYQSYVGNYLGNEPMPSIEDEYQIMNQLVPNIPLEAVNEAAKELITESDSNLVITAQVQEKEGKAYNTVADLKSTIAKVRAEQIAAYVDNVKNEPLISQLPKKGKITKETEDKKLGFKKLTLSNGAKVILKKTDFKDDEIVMSAKAKGGKDLYGAADYTNLKAFDFVINSCGLGNFSSTELQKALAGKQASAGLSIGLYHKGADASSTPKDIETMMQLVYLNFTALAKDEKALSSTMQQLELMLKNKNLQPEAVFSDSLQNARYAHNPFFAPLEMADLKNINADRVLQMAKEMTADAGQYTFTFAGNFDEATLRPLIEQYIASLPAKKTKVADKEVLTLAKGDVKCHFSRKMETPKSILYAIWSSDKLLLTLENNVLADAAGQILSMKYLRTIREEASAAYSVGANGYSQRTVDNQAYYSLLAGCPMDPAKAQQAYDLMMKGMAEAENAVDAADLQKVKEFMLKQADDDAKKNGHWLSIIEDYDEYGLDFHTDYKKVVSGLTPEKVAAFIKNVVIKSGNKLEVMMSPEK